MKSSAAQKACDANAAADACAALVKLHAAGNPPPHTEVAQASRGAAGIFPLAAASRVPAHGG